MTMQLRFDALSKIETSKVDIIIRNKTLETSIVYDYYWIFAKKRQDVFFERIAGRKYPWTDDAILQTFKFTNAYRASDRVSQYLIKNVIYNGSQSEDEVFFRTILFKLFNKIETWELLSSKLGEISVASFSFYEYDRVLTEAMERGDRIYSAAYIMPSRSIPSIHSKKHRVHLELIKKMLNDSLPAKIANAKSLNDVYNLFLSYPGIGKFLAFQYTIDLNYSSIIDFDEMDFVVAGPGAINGIMKCITNLNGVSNEYIIRYVAESQEKEFNRLGLEFKSLWGRPLQLIDCQNIFCEIDKYSRVRFPELSKQTGRTRIKQKYSCNAKKIKYWYPPKWGINNLIENTSEVA